MSATLSETRCCECDALEGECDHNGFRYMGPYKLEPVEGEGPRTRWKIPDHEKARVENGPGLSKSAPATETPVGIHELIEELEERMELDAALILQLEQCYATHPLRVTRIVAVIIEGHDTGKIHRPTGLLVYSLRAISDTPQ